jgi:acyl carrier protein
MSSNSHIRGIGRVDSIEEQLLVMFTNKFGSRPKASDGLAYIGVDSVGMAELTFDLEKQFGIRVDDDIVNTDTVQDLADYIRARQSPLESRTEGPPA